MGIFNFKSLRKSLNMKVTIVLLACVAVALAQQHGPGHHGPGGHNNLMHLVHNEVVELHKTDADLTAADCEQKCDAVFDLVADNDEAALDRMCKAACDCEINKNCGHQHPTHAPHQTHPTRAP